MFSHYLAVLKRSKDQDLPNSLGKGLSVPIQMFVEVSVVLKAK